MTVTEKVRETATELKENLRETVDELKEDVAQLKEKVGRLVPAGRRGRSVPVRHAPEGRHAVRGRPHIDDPWFDLWWPDARLARLMDLVDGEPLNDIMRPWPQVDVLESDSEILVRVELPGVEDDDIDISIDTDTLTIRGEKRWEADERGADRYHHECYYGSFRRTIPLSWAVERDGVTAKFEKGVLHVTLPKTSESRRRVRHIPVSRS